jgi:hypothetical protein
VALTFALRIALVGLAALALVSPPLAGAADRLPIARARERAMEFAKGTCAHDKSCGRSGVVACRRQADHIVLCRIFDHRRTEQQGSFVCTRLVRLALKLPSHRVPVTGVSAWDC